jgi:hypothetical protein
MITLTKKDLNIVFAVSIAVLIFIAALTIYSDRSEVKHKEAIHQKELELVKQKAEADQLIIDNVKLRQLTREKDEAYIKLDQDFRNNTELYITKIDELRKNKEKVKEVFKPYKDSTEVAIALVQFEGCKEENKIVIAQRDLLKSKSVLQDSIIVNLEQVITIDRKMFTNYENQIEIHKKYEKRLVRKNKLAKLTTVVVGIAGIVGIIIL